MGQGLGSTGPGEEPGPAHLRITPERDGHAAFPPYSSSPAEGSLWNFWTGSGQTPPAEKQRDACPAGGQPPGGETGTTAAGRLCRSPEHRAQGCGPPAAAPSDPGEVYRCRAGTQQRTRSALPGGQEGLQRTTDAQAVQLSSGRMYGATQSAGPSGQINVVGQVAGRWGRAAGHTLSGDPMCPCSEHTPGGSPPEEAATAQVTADKPETSPVPEAVAWEPSLALEGSLAPAGGMTRPTQDVNEPREAAGMHFNAC